MNSTLQALKTLLHRARLELLVSLKMSEKAYLYDNTDKSRTQEFGENLQCHEWLSDCVVYCKCVGGHVE